MWTSTSVKAPATAFFKLVSITVSWMYVGTLGTSVSFPPPTISVSASLHLFAILYFTPGKQSSSHSPVVKVKLWRFLSMTKYLPSLLPWICAESYGVGRGGDYFNMHEVICVTGTGAAAQQPPPPCTWRRLFRSRWWVWEGGWWVVRGWGLVLLYAWYSCPPDVWLAVEKHLDVADVPGCWLHT